MSGYALSRAADQDFENIFEFGIDTFGLDQALSYQDGLKQLCNCKPDSSYRTHATRQRMLN